jgi:hypothetical protein
VNRLLDANVFIEAKNRYYGFDICPGFWNWMDGVFDNGVNTIDRVWTELIADKEDELSKWARDRKGLPHILASSDADTQAAFGEVANFVARGGYRAAAINKFLNGADPWLVAKAMCNGATIVTHEQPAPDSKKRVPLPDICTTFSVPYEDTFDCLRLAKAEFELRSH